MFESNKDCVAQIVNLYMVDINTYLKVTIGRSNNVTRYTFVIRRILIYLTAIL